MIPCVGYTKDRQRSKEYLMKCAFCKMDIKDECIAQVINNKRERLRLGMGNEKFVTLHLACYRFWYDLVYVPFVKDPPGK